MRTFALVFALLAALLAVLLLRPFVSAPALAAGTTSVRVFEARNPARGLVDDRHDWIWIWPPAPGTDGRPVLLRRERSSGTVVGRYVPAPEKEAPLGVEWSETASRSTAALGMVRRETRLAMKIYVRPIEERRPIF